MKFKWYVWLPIIMGALLRFYFLKISLVSQAYYGGDAKGYISMGWILGDTWAIRPSNCFWTPGYSAYLAPFLKTFETPAASCFFNIFLNIAFTFWFSNLLAKNGSEKGRLISIWFLSLDPIWITQSITIGADYLGALLFGILFSQFLFKPVIHMSWTKGFYLGALCCYAAFVKPVYLYIPILLFVLQIPKLKFGRPRFGPLILFTLVWLIPIGLYVNTRGIQSGTYNFSGHSSQLFGKYIVGHIFVGLGKTNDGPEGEEMANKEHEELLKSNPDLTWGAHAGSYIGQYPVIFLKLFSASAFRTLFGNANMMFARYFDINATQGPGMWITLAQGQSLLAKMASISWSYILGAFFTIIEKALLVFFSLKGLLILKNKKKYIEMAMLFVIVCYFIFSPVVFGEPRYFLPGTLILLYLASLNWRKESQPCAE